MLKSAPSFRWFSENKLSWIIIALIGLIYFYIQFSSEGIGFGGDSFTHYLFSRYSWKYPEYFLHMWAKPFFTIVSSPFAQFGFTGISTFNLFCSLIGAYFLYLIARELMLEVSWVIIPLYAFVPVFLYHLPSGYTEPFFGLITILSTYLIVKRQFAFGIILASFLPFVRSEGFMLLPLFFMVLLMARRFYLLPLLLTGTIIYSLVGYPFKGDLLWVFLENPYKYGDDLYGKGNFLYFVNAAPKIFGVPLLILFFLGIGYFTKYFFQNFKQFWNNRLVYAFLLLSVSALGYFIAHSIFWGLGIFGSFGLTRVMAGIAPGIAFTAMLGIHGIYRVAKRFTFNRFLPHFITAGMVIWVAMLPFLLKSFPVKVSGKHKYSKEAALWLKNSQYFPPTKLYYMNSIVPIYLDMDPFGPNASLANTLNNEKDPGASMPDGSIVYWDSHHGPNDVPKDKLLNSDYLKVIRHVKPEPTFKVYGGNDYEIYYFLKNGSDQNSNE